MIRKQIRQAQTGHRQSSYRGRHPLRCSAALTVLLILLMSVTLSGCSHDPLGLVKTVANDIHITKPAPDPREPIRKLEDALNAADVNAIVSCFSPDKTKELRGVLKVLDLFGSSPTDTKAMPGAFLHLFKLLVPQQANEWQVTGMDPQLTDKAWPMCRLGELTLADDGPEKKTYNGDLNVTGSNWSYDLHLTFVVKQVDRTWYIDDIS